MWSDLLRILFRQQSWMMAVMAVVEKSATKEISDRCGIGAIPGFVRVKSPAFTGMILKRWRGKGMEDTGMRLRGVGCILRGGADGFSG